MPSPGQKGDLDRMKSPVSMHKPRKTARITGITGFVGSHLAELLLREGVSV